MTTFTEPPSENAIAILVDHFYERVRRDPELGAVFNPAVHDWPAHQALLTSFWCSVARGSRSYRGNPMAAHLRHPVRAEHFERWLALWRGACGEVLDAAAASRMIEYAERIGHSLKLGLGLRPHSRRLDLPMLTGAGSSVSEC
jgi:hemoglobin